MEGGMSVRRKNFVLCGNEEGGVNMCVICCVVGRCKGEEVNGRV